MPKSPENGLQSLNLFELTKSMPVDECFDQPFAKQGWSFDWGFHRRPMAKGVAGWAEPMEVGQASPPMVAASAHAAGGGRASRLKFALEEP